MDIKFHVTKIINSGGDVDDWFDFINQLKYKRTDRDLLVQIYTVALNNIKDTSTNGYKKMMIGLANLQSEVSLDLARRTYMDAKSLDLDCAVVCVFFAQFEYMNNDKGKARQIIQDAKQNGCTPKYILKKAYQNWRQNKLSLLDGIDDPWDTSHFDQTSDTQTDTQPTGNSETKASQGSDVLPANKTITRSVITSLGLPTRLVGKTKSASSVLVNSKYHTPRRSGMSENDSGIFIDNQHNKYERRGPGMSPFLNVRYSPLVKRKFDLDVYKLPDGNVFPYLYLSSAQKSGIKHQIISECEFGVESDEASYVSGNSNSSGMLTDDLKRSGLNLSKKCTQNRLVRSISSPCLLQVKNTSLSRKKFSNTSKINSSGESEVSYMNTDNVGNSVKDESDSHMLNSNKCKSDNNRSLNHSVGDSQIVNENSANFNTGHDGQLSKSPDVIKCTSNKPSTIDIKLTPKLNLDTLFDNNAEDKCKSPLSDDKDFPVTNSSRYENMAAVTLNREDRNCRIDIPHVNIQNESKNNCNTNIHQNLDKFPLSCSLKNDTLPDQIINNPMNDIHMELKIRTKVPDENDVNTIDSLKIKKDPYKENKLNQSKVIHNVFPGIDENINNFNKNNFNQENSINKKKFHKEPLIITDEKNKLKEKIIDSRLSIDNYTNHPKVNDFNKENIDMNEPKINELNTEGSIMIHEHRLNIADNGKLHINKKTYDNADNEEKENVVDQIGDVLAPLLNTDKNNTSKENKVIDSKLNIEKNTNQLKVNDSNKENINENKQKLNELNIIGSVKIQEDPLEIADSGKPNINKKVNDNVNNEKENIAHLVGDGLAILGKHGFDIDQVLQPVVSNKMPKVHTVKGVYYQEKKIIGKGGSCKVYEVVSQDGLLFALKKVNLHDIDDFMLKMYKNEIRFLEKMKGNKHIIRLYEWEIIDDVLLLVLEKGDCDLAHVLKTKKSLSAGDMKQYWKQMLVAVNIIHENGIVHTDLKPANFLLVGKMLKLIDFGIANDIQDNKTSVTRECQMGTLNYMSPEALVQDSGRISRASDVWSLGCILYSMVYKKTPYSHIKNQYARLYALQQGNPIVYKGIDDQLLLNSLQGCLKHARRERYSIQQLLAHPYLI